MNGAYLILISVSFLLFVADVSAETTFFDNHLENTFIMGAVATSETGGVVEVTDEGGSSSCFTNWICSAWGPCIGGGQTRDCVKEKSFCYTVVKKELVEHRSCSSNQLFDIKLELDDAVIENSNKLSATIRFENFGDVQIPINLTYRVLDSRGESVYLERRDVVVITEHIIRKNFGNLNLPSGKYSLVLTTVYGDSIRDEFRQEFEVTGLRIGITGNVISFVSGSGKWYGLAIIFGVIIFWAVYKIYIKKRFLRYGY